jgi:hypothetical protein
MAVHPQSLEVGQCYLTDTGKVRRVSSIVEGRVQFEVRLTSPRGRRWGWRPGILDLQSFADAAQRAVPYDWVPESDEA